MAWHVWPFMDKLATKRSEDKYCNQSQLNISTHNAMIAQFSNISDGSGGGDIDCITIIDRKAMEQSALLPDLRQPGAVQRFSEA